MAKPDPLNLSGYLVILACAITLSLIIFVIRKRNFLKRSGPLFPYFSTADPETRIEEAISNFKFEKFVVDKFDKAQFALFYWKGNRNGEIAVATPVLEFDFTATFPAIPFAVECRWKKDFESDTIRWSTHRDIERYKEYERQTKRTVYIIIGIGGEPTLPAQLYIVPLSKIPRHMDRLPSEYLWQFRRDEAGASFIFSRQAMRLM